MPFGYWLTSFRTLQPFPLNPTFSPLPPLADIIKTRIYNSYTYNLTSQPSATDASVVRAISAKFGVSMMRVRAVIRLKELEKRWKDEVRPRGLLLALTPRSTLTNFHLPSLSRALILNSRLLFRCIVPRESHSKPPS